MRTRSIPRAACAVGLLLSACGCTATSQQRLAFNKRLVLQNAEAFNRHDEPALAATLHPELRRHCQATPGVEVRSAEEFLNFARSDWATFPDGRLTVEHAVAGGDLVAVWGRYTGTQRESMGPFPPSGESVELDFAGVFRIEDERIAEIWVTWDNLTALAQLGHWAPPTPGGPSQ